MKTKLLEHDKRFDVVFDELEKYKQEEFKQKIFFNGQIYDAYHIGASLKDLRKKCFAISKIEDMEYIEKMSKFN